MCLHLLELVINRLLRGKGSAQRAQNSPSGSRVHEQGLLDHKVTQHKVTHRKLRCGRQLFNVHTPRPFSADVESNVRPPPPFSVDVRYSDFFLAFGVLTPQENGAGEFSGRNKCHIRKFKVRPPHPFFWCDLVIE